jgi:hypothetical protein
MADKKISALTAATTPLAGTEVLPIVQTGTTVKASIANVQAAPVSAGTANAIQYLNASKAPTTSSNLLFDGAVVAVGGTSSAWSGVGNVVQLTGTALWGSGAVGHVSLNTYFDGTNYKYISTDFVTDYYQFGGSHVFRYAPSGTAGTNVPFNTGMTLDASGNFLVGATSSSLGQSGFLFLPNYTAAGNSGAAIQHINGSASGSNYLAFIYNAGQIGNISQSGTTGVLYNLTSDYRLKNDPQPLTGSKEFVMALQPKKWQWWDGSGEGVGFIAHEFMEVAKQSGVGEKDAVDKNGNPQYQAIQPSSAEVIANLVSFIQELRTEFDEYKLSHP